MSKSILVFTFLLIIQQALAQDLSDNDIKTNVHPIVEPVQQIMSLNPKVFEYNSGRYKHLALPAGQQYGFVAEEFQQVFPGLVQRKAQQYMVGKNSYRTSTLKLINLEGLIPVLIACVQQQQEEITILKKELEELKKR